MNKEILNKDNLRNKEIVLELKNVKRPEGFSILIAVDNGFEDDDCYPVTGISEEDFNNLTEESE